VSKSENTSLIGGMRILVLLCVALAGCFEEQQSSRDAATGLLVESIVAFADIQANLESDPAKAGEALAKFLRAPVAVSAILDQPFDASLAMGDAARIPAPTGIPACLDTTGDETGCDGFTTKPTMECEAGDFRFTGTASRMCSPCANVTGTCDYTFDLTLSHRTSDFTIDVDAATLAPVRVDASNIRFDTTLSYTVMIGAFSTSGNARVCSCGAMTLNASRLPVSSSMVAKDVAVAGRCARIDFDAAGGSRIVPACTCADGGCL